MRASILGGVAADAAAVSFQSLSSNCLKSAASPRVVVDDFAAPLLAPAVLGLAGIVVQSPSISPALP
jgi:hypothetical protein